MKASRPIAIGLGSNLSDPPARLREALRRLNETPGLRLRTVSSFYRSVPQGPSDQPDYANACALLDADLAPHEVLAALQRIERAMGRRKTRRWGEREIDLDLLLYDNEMIKSATLIVPHPWMHRRDFVLRPLAEIAPRWPVPGRNGTVAELSSRLPADATFVLEKICPPPSLP